MAVQVPPTCALPSLCRPAISIVPTKAYYVRPHHHMAYGRSYPVSTSSGQAYQPYTVFVPHTYYVGPCTLMIYDTIVPSMQAWHLYLLPVVHHPHVYVACCNRPMAHGTSPAASRASYDLPGYLLCRPLW